MSADLAKKKSNIFRNRSETSASEAQPPCFEPDSEVVLAITEISFESRCISKLIVYLKKNIKTVFDYGTI